MADRKTKAPNHTAVPRPVWRRLRAYAFDPSLSTQLDTATINEVIINVRWEDRDEFGDGERLRPGPIGEYLEVIDYDPPSQLFYEPVDLNNPYILAQDGLPPSEGNPQFHEQMVYAVGMTTIQNFERALGRYVFWAPRIYRKARDKEELVDEADPNGVTKSEYVQRLRIYPHALRDENAYYSWRKKAILFGYFKSTSHDLTTQFPGGTVFTCLSHDIIAHEITHALLDGMHRRFIEPTHPDALAFHEAFADIVALFQHFSYPQVLRHQIARTQGDLSKQNLLGELAQQFGRAIGNYGALRSAIGHVNPETRLWEPITPNPEDYQTIFQPHSRGAILVAAMFDVFLVIYKRRVSDLLRIATGGSGVLPEGALHPDLVNRLADEASKSARHVLTMCIRALDYCPPVDITFGDYLRALITSDYDTVPDDDYGYRIAIVESFRRHGIYPPDIRTLSVDSLLLPSVTEKKDRNLFRVLVEATRLSKNERTELENLLRMPRYSNRRQTYNQSLKTRELVHELIENVYNEDILRDFEDLTGLILLRDPNRFPEREQLNLKPGKNAKYRFEVYSARRARRATPDGDVVNQVIVTLTQQRTINGLTFRGGCTLIFGLDETLPLRYAIAVKRIDDEARWQRQRDFMVDANARSLNATYFSSTSEQFAHLHGGDFQ
jgi:hypothetical protein